MSLLQRLSMRYGSSWQHDRAGLTQDKPPSTRTSCIPRALTSSIRASSYNTEPPSANMTSGTVTSTLAALQSPEVAGEIATPTLTSTLTPASPNPAELSTTSALLSLSTLLCDPKKNAAFKTLHNFISPTYDPIDSSSIYLTPEPFKPSSWHFWGVSEIPARRLEAQITFAVDVKDALNLLYGLKDVSLEDLTFLKAEINKENVIIYPEHIRAFVEVAVLHLKHTAFKKRKPGLVWLVYQSILLSQARPEIETNAFPSPAWTESSHAPVSTTEAHSKNEGVSRMTYESIARASIRFLSSLGSMLRANSATSITKPPMTNNTMIDVPAVATIINNITMYYQRYLDLEANRPKIAPTDNPKFEQHRHLGDQSTMQTNGTSEYINSQENTSPLHLFRSYSRQSQRSSATILSPITSRTLRNLTCPWEER
ncbi:MAG: hypothetical protein M1834_001522 [Cirrosporium novae-zelandiae]|nr:MAG: hypothetical protein M1834_004039 [Cirrosporium novae-zelandiae]KAI9735507.1 MAG: hypothetical protein M1834_001522 [Cirrosporium novae-zelandiae]